MPAKKSTSAKSKAKTTAKKKPAAGKSTAKKPASRSKATKAKKPEIQSFKLIHETEPFMTTRISTQTFYWAVLGVIVIAFSLWINHLNTQIQELYDIVDRNIAEATYMNDSYAAKHAEMLKRD